ncbi:hypothetical protein B5E77_15835 [Lachnoclostridium sp. An131]|uniref:PepSY domain-containing protein n=1 Tax=Lachnoclostridium sp. An131 TaxID=1965555 RepID=UPI000B3A0AA5|nr:PepSY domain-containing protein [Lachnoclostridium sp. An131]OUQ23219.1 hypothetical protein B5E77_15835 [Lachnoclostridium sp. An131]
MKFRRTFLVTVSSLAILSTALLTGCGSQQTASDSSTQTSAEEITAEAPAEAGSTALAETGILVLSVNPEIQIDYDKEGIVTAITGRNEDGKKIAEASQDEIGKNCDEVLKNLITEIHSAGYFVEDIDGHQKNIVVQIEPGSVLPSDDFLESMSASTQSAVKGLNLTSDIVTIDDDDYDPTYTTAEKLSPYITLEKAKEIALAQADVSAADAVFDDKEFDHDDGTAIFELEFTANGVEYEYDVDAVTGKVLKAEHKGGSQTGTPAQTSTGSTNYDDTDYGPNNDGVTDYNDTDYGPNNDGVTDYNDTDYGPNNDGVTDYNDTDYGPNNDGVTDYNDTDYGPNNDGVTDYNDTDYGPNNDGVTDYGSTNYDDGGTTNYDDGSTNYDDSGTTNYDDGSTNYGSTNYDDGGSNYSDDDDD